MNNLTEEQCKIVYSNSKVSIALGVPGCGKSYVLLSRAKRLWDDYKEKILILTFTNNAVDDLIDKLEDQYRDKISVKTIHSYCLKVLKDHEEYLKLFFGTPDYKGIKITSKEEDQELFSKFVNNKNVESRFENILKLRKFGLDPNALLSSYKKGAYFGSSSDVDCKEFLAYETYRVGSGLLYFDDLINVTKKVMCLPEVSINMTRQFNHILIDEAQDTSDDQWDIIRPLATHSKTTLLVGDANQSIYEWRGARSETMTSFGYSANTTIFRMTKSFRNPKSVAELANKVCIDKESQIVSEREGETIIKCFDTLEKEISYVINKIQPGDVIIARTNTYLDAFENELIKRNIRYYGKSYFTEEHIISFIDWLSGVKTNPEWQSLFDKEFLVGSKFSKVELSDLRNLFKKVVKMGINPFFQFLSSKEDRNGVCLCTGHSSKGLEWDNVFLVGMDDKNMPHRLSTDEKEELNLLYVMITRAKKNLYISSVGNRSHYIGDDI